MKSAQIDDIVRENYYNRPRKKVSAPDMVDRVATVVRLERLGMLEVEDEVDERAEELSWHHRCQRSHLFTFLGTYRRMCGFGGGGCRGDFRLRCETE